MTKQSQNVLLFSLLTAALGLVFLLNISLGSVSIPFGKIADSIFGNPIKSSWETILWQFRLPKAITALFVGMGLSVAGLLMQTLFRNPLAGPYVLGLNAGSSLGVALLLLGTGFLPTFLLSEVSLVIASSIGSLVVFLAILLVSQKLRNTTSILIVGLMFASFTSAFVGVLAYFSSAEALQRFTFWAMGSLANLNGTGLILLVSCCVVGLLLSLSVLKPLNALLLGEVYAKSLGIPFKKVRWMIIIATSLLSGSITAFVGPIAFIGLAVPHITKLIFQTSNHFVLFVGTILMGAILMLLCDLIAQLPGSDLMLPINTITSFVGAPMVVWLLVRKKKILI
uniref:iron chelate uptake ABC transporter family permease subunit n=1 Tax=Flavobacterium sp. TaxID=239 RepID=UPI0040494677